MSLGCLEADKAKCVQCDYRWHIHVVRHHYSQDNEPSPCHRTPCCILSSFIPNPISICNCHHIKTAFVKVTGYSLGADSTVNSFDLIPACDVIVLSLHCGTLPSLGFTSLLRSYSWLAFLFPHWRCLLVSPFLTNHVPLEKPPCFYEHPVLYGPHLVTWVSWQIIGIK